MKILCVGGGSGGHITPIVAVIDEISKQANSAEFIKNSSKSVALSQTKPADSPMNNLEIRVWVDKKFAPQARELMAGKARVDVIGSGKFRRYANLKWWYRWFSWYHITKTHLPNLRDFFKIIGGFAQSFAKLARWRPGVIFCKGGYVCLPVGLAARMLKIPLVIHDSDTVPGLTNKVLAKFAAAIGTGSPIENYPNYPRKITKFVGVPVRPDFKHLTKNEQAAAKEQLGFEPDKPLIFATGGGLGATGLNDSVAKNAAEIISQNNAQILLLSGRGKKIGVPPKLAKDFVVKEFITDDFSLAMGAADVAIVRSSATTLAELAATGVATILIPAPYISGDHQAKNAEVYEKAEAAVLLSQFDLNKEPQLLAEAIHEILADGKFRKNLSANLRKFAKPDALEQMAKMILAAAKISRRK